LPFKRNPVDGLDAVERPKPRVGRAGHELEKLELAAGD
jgi:hypothetical protein